jgi:tetratricopeptide (TPR) repeat protein
MARGVARFCENDLPSAGADFAKARKSRSDEVAYTWSAAVATMRGEANPPRPTQETRSADSAAMTSYQLLLGHAARLYPNNPRMASEEFPQIARRFAAGQAVQAFLLAPVMARARQLVDAGQYEQAMPLIEQAWKSDQPLFSLVRLTADCRFGQGDWASARTWYTNLIMLKTNDAHGYANRAVVMAKLGRMDRAKADMAILLKLDPKLAASTEKTIAPVAMTAVAEPADRQAFYPDEEYQEDLRRLSDAVRADPENPDALTKLAEFIDDPKIDRDFTFPGGAVRRFGIRMESHDYGRERAVLAKALKRDPRHVAALTQTACMLSNEQQWPLCQTFVQRALDLGGRDPALLLLYMDFCTNDAEQRFANAGELRRTKVVGFSRVERGDGTVETSTTYRMPSTEELAQAAALDQQSGQLRRQGAQPVLDGIKQFQGTQRGYYLTAKYLEWIGHDQDAEVNMRKAVALDPFFIVVHGQVKVTLQKFAAAGDAPERIEVIDPPKSLPAPQPRRNRGDNNAAR